MGVRKFEQLESELQRLQCRFPDLPVAGVLLSRLLLHLGRGMSTMLDLEIRPFGLAEVEFRVLVVLYSQAGGAFASELCASTSQSPASMSRISDALVGRELISRLSSLHDRRRMLLRITERGEALVRRLLPTLYGPLRDMLKDVPDDAQRHLIEQLKALSSKLDLAMTGHSPERAR